MPTNSTAQKQTGASRKKLLGNLEIAAFCDQLAMVIAAGLPAYEGISILLEDAEDPETKKILAAIYEPLESGSTFYDALAASGIFPDYMLHMVEIGEMSGKLEEVLKSLSNYYQREESIRTGIRSAVTYPLIMVVIMIAVILVLIAKVLPVFNQIYEELGTSLTGFALSMMHFSEALNTYFVIILASSVLLLLAAFLFSRTKSFQTFIQGRRFAMDTAASRFANCMFLALSSGLDTTQGLELALRLVNNPHMAKRIQHCKDRMDSGSGFLDAILASGIFNRTYSSLLTIGFRTGSMDSIMDQISQKYEEETDNEINRFLSLLEPSLVIFLSVLIGLILISFLLPLVGIMSSIG